MLDTLRRPAVIALALVSPLLLSCASDGPAAPRNPIAIGCSTPTPVTLEALRGIAVSFPASCARVENAGRYLAVPQYAVQEATPTFTPFTLISGAPAAAMIASAGESPAASVGSSTRGTMTIGSAFDARLRRLEGELARQSTPLARNLALSRAATEANVVAADSVRTFNVLASLEGNSLVTTTARLKYEGPRVLIYEDVGVEYHYTAAEFAALGKLFDEVLYPIDTAAFGSPSDIDGNGHITVLMSQRINQLTKAADCPTKGFVAGYFYGLDLLPDRQGSNRGEVFYTIAPDSVAKFSCAHTKAYLNRNMPATFIHEFQHMISFNQHVLIRNGNSEIAWLNEGLSHIAEELGSKYYEAKYPPPSGRASPSQLFPDSAQGFGPPQFANAYNYLLDPTKHSVTTFEGLGTLEERGAAWLFLRWLADQKGEGIFKQLVQTSRRGVDNVAAVAGEPFAALFGDFGIATYTDSIDGVPRTSIPTRYRFTSRNTRQIFARLYPIKPNPITPTPLGCGASANATMVQATQAYFIVGGTTGCVAQTRVEFAPAKTGGSLAPQLGLFRLP
ncbi:MAG TPA: hypothetical protein VHM67_00395 [Gemmatimonadaceae bacterium]|nr:hypothetical protein [Gemmatimonadaceae bacterium]